MKPCLKCLILLAVFGMLSLFSDVRRVYALDSLKDEFNYIDTSVWNSQINGGSVIIDSGSLVVSANRGTKFPFIVSNDLPYRESFEVELRFMFSGSVTYGNGIVFSDYTPQNNSSVQLDATNTIFQVWPKSNSIFGIWTPLCPDTNLDCDTNIKREIPIDSSYNTFGQWHLLKISFHDGLYRLDIDGSNVFSSGISNKKISVIWIGNYERTLTENYWPTISLDYLYFSTDYINSQKTIIIPGLGASWDFKALLSGTDGDNWKIPSFVNNYDGLISSFNNAGYSKVKGNLFVFPYDWRKPLSILAEKLNDYIEANVPVGEKVNLVGHSMGGLLARAYAQEYGASRINKIVMVGSPNMGSVKAYPAWEGGMLIDENWWGKTALALTTHFGFIIGETNIQTVQRMIPSLKDLLPTYDYLSMNGQLVPWSSTQSKNTYLDGLNQNYASIDSLATAIYSNDIPTNAKIKVVPHTVGDLGTWIDGKPIQNPFIKESGDGTVIEESAKGPFSSVVEGSGWHGELVTNVDDIQKIFSALGVDTTGVVAGVYDDRTNSLIVALRSPGKLDICNSQLTVCNEQLGWYYPELKLFILPGYEGQNLVVSVTENGELGKYALHFGDVDQKATWRVVNGNLKNVGEVDSYILTDDRGRFTVETLPGSKDECKKEKWKTYFLSKFRNQGECISFVERNKRPHNKFFWWR